MQPSLPSLDVRYGQAVISWCSNLTDPQATSEAIAVFLVAQTGTRRIAAIVMRGSKDLSRLDPLTRVFMRTLPEHLQNLLQCAILAERDISLEQLLHRVKFSLNGSWWVSETVPIGTENIGGRDLFFHLAERACQTLRRAAALSNPPVGEPVTKHLFEFSHSS